YDAVSYDAVSYDAVSYDAVSYDAVSYDAVSYDAVRAKVTRWRRVTFVPRPVDRCRTGHRRRESTGVAPPPCDPTSATPTPCCTWLRERIDLSGNPAHNVDRRPLQRPVARDGDTDRRRRERRESRLPLPASRRLDKARFAQGATRALRLGHENSRLR